MVLTHLIAGLNQEQAISHDEIWDWRPTHNRPGQEYKVVQLTSHTIRQGYLRNPNTTAWGKSACIVSDN